MKDLTALVLCLTVFCSSIHPVSAMADSRDSGGSVFSSSTTHIPSAARTLESPDQIESQIENYIKFFNEGREQIRAYLASTRVLNSILRSTNSTTDQRNEALKNKISIEAQKLYYPEVQSDVAKTIEGRQNANTIIKKVSDLFSTLNYILKRQRNSSFNQVVAYLSVRWWLSPIDQDAAASLLQRLTYVANDKDVGVGEDNTSDYIKNGILYTSFAATLLAANYRNIGPAIANITELGAKNFNAASRLLKVAAKSPKTLDKNGLARFIRYKRTTVILPALRAVLPNVGDKLGVAGRAVGIGAGKVATLPVKVVKGISGAAVMGWKTFLNSGEHKDWLKNEGLPKLSAQFAQWKAARKAKLTDLTFRLYQRKKMRDYVTRAGRNLLAVSAGGAAIGYAKMLIDQGEEVRIDPKDALLWIQYLGADQLMEDMQTLNGQVLVLNYTLPIDNKTGETDMAALRSSPNLGFLLQRVNQLSAQYSEIRLRLNHLTGDFCHPTLCGLADSNGDHKDMRTYRPKEWVTEANSHLARADKISRTDRLANFAKNYKDLWAIIDSGEKKMKAIHVESVSLSTTQELVDKFEPAQKRLAAFANLVYPVSKISSPKEAAKIQRKN